VDVDGPDFRPDEAQGEIVRLAGEVLDGNADTPDRLWKALGQAGLLTLAVPEALGGAGLGPLETFLVLTEVGRRAAAGPALSTLALGVLPVVRWGSPEQHREVLAGVGEGRVLTAAVTEPGAPITAAPRTTMTPAPATATAQETAQAAVGWLVTGTKSGVLDADRAHRVLVPARTAGGETAVVLVDPGAPGVTLTRTPSFSGAPEFTMRLDAVPAERLGGADCLAGLHRFAVAGACAVGDGALAGALGLTAEHVRTRHQFGRPLATFQAVAQQIADVYVSSRTMHLAAATAGWGLADADLWTAAHWLTGEAPPALRTCHHLHGGLGLAADYPLHRFGSLVRDLVRFLGGTEHCLDRLSRSAVENRGETGRARCTST
jgi:hypothetical protein